MSCYNWERGTIKIPAAEWKRVRDALTAAHNAGQDKAHALAVEVHQKLVSVKASKGSKALKSSVYDTLRADPTSAGLFAKLERIEDAWHVLRAVQKVDEKTGKVTLTSPKKKDFAHAVSSKATTFGAGEASISFDHQARSVTWSVQENNHAVERARESEMGKALFRLLATVKWTRGTGGEIAGNDEYRRSERGAGDAANYVTARFGPLGEKNDPMRKYRSKERAAGVASMGRGLFSGGNTRRW